LGEIEFQIYNSGSEVIKDAVLTIFFSKGAKILYSLFSYGPNEAGPDMDIRSDEQSLTFKLPYLNPVREHEHRVPLTVVIDGDPEKVFVHGSGEGYSTVHLKLPRLDQYQRRFKRVGILVTTFMTAVPLYVFWVSRTFGLDPNEISWRSLLFSIPFFLFGALLLVYIVRPLKRLIVYRASGRLR
jgi:hypothetical protein